MKKLIQVILFSFFTLTLTSCASIFNKEHKNIRFLSEEEPISFYLYQDTSQIYKTNTTIPIKRNRAPLQINIKKENDSISTFLVPEQFSKTFIYGNYPYGIYGFSWFADMLMSRKNDKISSFPGKISLKEDSIFVYPYIPLFSSKPVAYYLPIENSVEKNLTVLSEDSYQKHHLPPVKGSIIFNWNILSISFLNRAFFNDRYTGEAGFGMGLGLEYYLQSDLTLNAGIESTFHFGGFGDDSLYDKHFAFLYKIQFNKQLNKKNWGSLGIQMNNTYSRERKSEIFNPDYQMNCYFAYYKHHSELERIRKEYKNNYGLALSLRHKTKTYSFSLDYYSSFLSQTTKNWDFEYNHIISINISRSFWVKR